MIKRKRMLFQILVFMTIWAAVSGEKETCPEPGVSPHGSRKGECCSVGDVLSYSCRKTFQRIGDELIVCLPGGNWNAPRPRCRPPAGICPDPPAIKNGVLRLSSGQKSGDFYSIFEEVEIVCDPGFVFSGTNKYVFCEDNFQWDIEFGKCEEGICSDPGTPENGMKNGGSFTIRSRVTFSCSPGYYLIGSAERYCLPNKQWSGVEAKCSLKHTDCPNPGIPVNGKRNGSNFNEWGEVIYTCEEGFELFGSNVSWCLPDGTWSGESVICLGNHCLNPGVPINGKRSGDTFKKGDNVTFSCLDGFRLVGSNISWCLEDGTWSAKGVKCLEMHELDKVSDACDESKKEGIVEKQAQETRKNLQENRRTHVPGGPLNVNYPGRLILHFLFDVSGSIGENNFNKSIRFAKALVEKIGVSKDGTRVGAITFSSRSNLQFLPVHYSTTNEVLKGLDEIKYEKGGSALYAALQIVREEMIPLSNAHFGRRQSKHVIFLLTDGGFNKGGNPVVQADLLKDTGVEIFCIGITGNVRSQVLYDMASMPPDQHVFLLNHYLILDWLVQEIIDGIIDFSECGLASGKIRRPRMVGGRLPVEPWPWMAALYFRDEKSSPNSQFKCGGSVIGRRWILTVAQCLMQPEKITPTTDIIIKLGLTDLRNATQLQEFDAEKFLIHPEYGNIETFDYNVALIKLNRPIEYNRYIRPVCLPPNKLSPTSNLYRSGEDAFAIGWGYDQAMGMGQRSEVKLVNGLKEVIFPLQERNTCLQSILNHGLPESMLTERMLCAGKGDGSADMCIGDSGSPLMQKQINEKGDVYWTQIGIVSWGLGCAIPNTYGFYTHVHNILPWIHSQLNES